MNKEQVLQQMEVGKVYRAQGYYLIRLLESQQEVHLVHELKYIGEKLNDFSGFQSGISFSYTDVNQSALAEDPFSESRHLFQYPIITNEDRKRLVLVEKDLGDFEAIIKKSVILRQDSFTNAIIIKGAPGTGKTSNTVKWLEDLIGMNTIEEYEKISGKITPVTLFKFLEQTHDRKIHVLDDCDVFQNVEALNILKSALDTKMEDDFERVMTYGSGGVINKVTYDGYTIIITNHDFTNPTAHVAALLDRVNVIELPFTVKDMFLLTQKAVETLFQSNQSISDSIKLEIRDLLHTEIKEFIEMDLFTKCRINFSFRFILKLVEQVRLFGDTWKIHTYEYKKLTDTRDKLLAVEAALKQAQKDKELNLATK